MTTHDEREAERAAINAEPLYSPGVFALVQANGPDLMDALTGLLQGHQERLAEVERPDGTFQTVWALTAASTPSEVVSITIVTFPMKPTTAIMLTTEADEADLTEEEEAR